MSFACVNGLPKVSHSNSSQTHSYLLSNILSFYQFLITTPITVLVNLSFLSSLPVFILALFSDSHFRLRSHLYGFIFRPLVVCDPRCFFRLYPELQYTFAWMKDSSIIGITSHQWWPIIISMIKLPIPRVTT